MGTIRKNIFVTDGTVTVKGLQELNQKLVTVTIHEYIEPVTPQEHAYYRALNRWLTQNTEEFGGKLEQEVHKFAKSLFLFKYITVDFIHNGEKKSITHSELLSLSDPDLGKKKVAEFISQWRDWLLYELNIETPDAEYFSATTVNRASIEIDDNSVVD